MKKINKTTLWLSLCAMVAALIIIACYPSFEQNAANYSNDYYQNTRELNLQGDVLSSTLPLYYEMKKKETPELQPYELFIAPGQSELSTQNAQALSDVIFSKLKSIDTKLDKMEYSIKDLNSDTNLVTGNEENLQRILQGDDMHANYAWYIAFTFDQNGVMTIQNYYKDDFSYAQLSDEYSGWMTKLFSSSNFNLGRYSNSNNSYSFRFSNSDITFELETVKDATFVFAVDEPAFEALYPVSNYTPADFIIYSGLLRVPLYLLVGALALLLLLRKTDFSQPIPIYRYFRKIPAEIHLLIVGFLLLGMNYGICVDATLNSQHLFLINGQADSFFGYLYLYGVETFFFWFVIFSYIAYAILEVKEMISTGSWKYQFLGFRLLRWIKRKFKYYFHFALSFDLSDADDKKIGTAILINFIVLFIITSFWAFGWFLLVLYSFALYVIAKNYLNKIRKDYATMLDVTKRIAGGNLEQNIDEDMGIFNAFKDHMINIRTGFKTAVEEEVHSQRMKTELISNVSHDLKTPLTSIISYLDLLKNENLKKADRMKYIDILDRNSIRLKHLIEDLFEVSKANSGAIKIEKMSMDLCSLMKQVEVELEDQLKANSLDLRNQFSDEKIICYLDPQKTYRILENLMSNVSKYAMPSTRVYIEITDFGSMVEVSLRNISAAELNFDPNDITERFTRGDTSRNTDGSGLGLAIARSFTEVQLGTLNVSIDGDLFKVILRLPKEEPNKQETAS